MSRNKYPIRKQIRLEGYDYRKGGVYFITICTHKRECIFGEITDGKMGLNSWGQIVIRELKKMERLRENVILDVLVCMPNHVHIIIWMLHNADMKHPLKKHDADHVIKPGSLGAVIRGFKAAVTREINLIREGRHAPVWQGRFYDRIIRNEVELNAIRQYIQANPQNWKEDHEWDEGLDDYLKHKL